MKRLYNFLVPKFLRNFDDYLLRNYPVVWRTKVVFVLFYGVVGAVVLFVAGFLYACLTLDAQNLLVEPYYEIRLVYETYNLWSALVVSISIFYWAYRQYQLGFPFTKLKDTLLTLFLYASSFWLLFSVVTPAFRLGIIYNTAYYWIDTDDMKKLEDSKIYPYGFILLEKDSIYTGTPTDAFFQTRERIFDSIWQVEVTLLQHLYTNDTLFWKNWYATHKLLDEKDLNHDLSDLSDLSYKSYWEYRLSLSDLSYKTYRSDLGYNLKMGYKSYLEYQAYLSSYEQYKQKHSSYLSVFDKYGFNKSTDSTEVAIYDDDGRRDSLTVYRAALPYSVEQAVYAVKNARFYLAEKIYTKHWALVLKYVLLLATLFYFIPFLSIRHLFGLLAACLLASVIIAFKLPKEISKEIGLNISNVMYLLLPTLSCLLLLWSSFQKKQTKSVVFAEQGLFVGLLCVLMSALFVIYREKAEFSDMRSFQPPFNLAFYGVQVLGVLGAVLTTYVRTLPKG